MKTLQEVVPEVKPTLQKLEEYRQQQRQNITGVQIWLWVPGLAFILAIVFVFNAKMPLTIGFGFFSFIGFVGILSSTSNNKKRYRFNFKHQIIAAFAKTLYPNIFYSPYQKVAAAHFKAARLFESWNHYNGEDFFKGKTKNGLPFQFSELTVQDYNNANQSTRNNVFRGLFFVLEIPQVTHGQIYIFPNKQNSISGAFSGFFESSFRQMFSHSRRVVMRHPQFERFFDVYSTNPSVAHKILTKDILDKIYDLSARWRSPVRVSFISNRLYIALPKPGDMFEPNLNLSLLDDRSIYQFYNQLALCFSIVEKFSETKS